MLYTTEEQRRLDNYVNRAIDAMMDEGYEIVRSSKDRAYSIVEKMYAGNQELFNDEKFLRTYKKKFPDELGHAVFVPKLSPEQLKAYQEQQEKEEEDKKKAHRLKLAERRKAAKEEEAARVAAMTPHDRILYRLEQQKLAEEKAKTKAEKLAKKESQNS